MVPGRHPLALHRHEQLHGAGLLFHLANLERGSRPAEIVPGSGQISLSTMLRKLDGRREVFHLSGYSRRRYRNMGHARRLTLFTDLNFIAGSIDIRAYPVHIATAEQ